MGGWVATDEACSNYEDIINNMQFGHSWLRKEFGITPKVGWMLDAFGHTAANAALFADFGFEAIFFSRLDQKERQERMKPQNHSMNFLWRPMHKHFGKQKEILGHIFDYNYETPKGLYIDERNVYDDEQNESYV
jgi:alpha-mannosidase